MKIEKILVQTPSFVAKKNIVKPNLKEIAPEQETNNNHQKVYASNICFKGGNVQLVNLMNDYKWFVRHDKKSPIDAFLQIKAPKEDMENLANAILTDDNLSFNFIKSLTHLPRKIKRYHNNLKEIMPENGVFFNLYNPTNNYRIAYEKYIEKRIENAQSISELLTIRPDWKEDFLLKKHQELYGNDSFELGQVPHRIGKDNFLPIVEYLKGFMDYGFKTRQDIPSFTINNKTFEIEKLIDGRSDKNVFKITSPEGRSFVLKMADVNQRGLNKPFAIGTCCIIDQYLTRNNCRNSARLRYYNHDNNVAIYDFVEHETTTKMHSFAEFIEKMPDFTDLGLRHSDTVGNNNYFKLNQNQDVMRRTFDFAYGVKHNELISVDNDHVTYNQPLCPMVYKYHKDLPTGMQMFN